MKYYLMFAVATIIGLVFPIQNSMADLVDVPMDKTQQKRESDALLAQPAGYEADLLAIRFDILQAPDPTEALRFEREKLAKYIIGVNYFYVDEASPTGAAGLATCCGTLLFYRKRKKTTKR